MNRSGAKRRGIAGRLLPAAVATVLLLAGLPTSLRAATPPAQACDALLEAPAHGAQAVALVGPAIATVAEDNSLPVATLRDRLLTDDTLWVDPCGRLFYVDPAVSEGDLPTATEALSAPETAAFPDDQTFLLHSRSGANRVIYLDFNGELLSGTAWNDSYNGGNPFTAPAYDTNGSPSTFSSAELAVVQSVWQRVAEDYAPFNVDVTTEDPGVAAIDRTGSGDTVYGTRALITNDSLVYNQCGCGGVAYVGVFDLIGTSHQYYQPALVFQRGLTGAKSLAEATSHEVGHNLGLSHDGTASVGYYAGQGSWAPIMGVGYSKPIVQWSKGEYTAANNHEDDTAVIVANGAPLRPDDYSDTRTSAFSLGSGASLSADGFIGTRTDIDWFSFTGSGSTTVTVTPAAVSPDLDVLLGLYTNTGTLLASADPAAATISQDVASGLSASIMFTLPSSGTYFVSVDGVGFGTALTTGYSDYASLGQYSLALSTATGTSGATYVSLTPARVLDTRNGTGLSGTFSSGLARTFAVTGHGGVPAGAIAVTGNLTVTNQTSPGFAALTPDPINNPPTSTLNFPLADNRANGVTVDLSATGTLSATYLGEGGVGQTTDLIFDVTGYYVPNTSGATYVSLTPARVLDTRNGTGLSGTFGSGLARTFAVTGHGGVPAGAIAVTGNLTVTNQTSPGFAALTPDPINNPPTSTLNFPLADNRANGVTVDLSATGTLSATYLGEGGVGQTTDLIFDVTGYYVPNTSGATYVSLTPARLLDTRNGTGLSGTFSSGAARTFAVTGHGGVPAGAIAVTGNLTVTNQTSPGFAALTPDPINNPPTSTLNFPLADNRANGVTVDLSATGTLSATYLGEAGPTATTHLIFDVTGYFVP